MRLKFSIIIISIILIFNSCSHRIITKENLINKKISTVQQIDKLLNNPSFDPATIGVYIEEMGSGKILYAKNEHKLLMPASNMKLVTTASVLSLLGAEYKYKTNIYTDGVINNGILNGNLIIKGSGDPVICGRFHSNNPDSIFILWSLKLKELGINTINGNIIGDNSIYGDDGLGYGWEKDDLPYYYAAKTNGLSFNDNCIDLHITPGKKIGDITEIIQNPVANYLKIDNQMLTVHQDSSSSSTFYRSYLDDKLVIKGTMSINSKTDIDWTPVPNPADFFLNQFGKVLKMNNINYSDLKLTKEKIDYSDKKLLFVHKSVPMKDIVHNINKISNNYYAETVQKTLCQEEEITTKKAIKIEKEFLYSIGIDADRIFIVDGSGLSRHNMVTTHQIVTILKYMSSNKNAQIFKESLPIGGVDGTLKRRLKGSNAKGHVFAKTGYVGHVRALSGYVEAINGKEYVFSIIANHYPTPTSQINNLQDQIVTILYNQNK